MPTGQVLKQKVKTGAVPNKPEKPLAYCKGTKVESGGSVCEASAAAQARRKLRLQGWSRLRDGRDVVEEAI